MTATDLGGGRPQPAALVVLCADPVVRDEVVAELHKRYRADYAVVAGATVDEVAAELASVPDRRVALVLGGYSSREPEGLEAIAQVSAGYPQALRAAVVRWGELDIAESMFAAVTAGQLDAWVFRPQTAGDEEFHLARDRAARRVGQPERGGVRGGAADRRAVVGRGPPSCGTCSSATTCRPVSTTRTRPPAGTC